MSVKSVMNGWECECGIVRNSANEVWKDCMCKKERTNKDVEKSNSSYWKCFWK